MVAPHLIAATGITYVAHLVDEFSSIRPLGQVMFALWAFLTRFS